MCGLTGILSRAGGSPADIGDTLSAMTGVLQHRGPDAEGMWIDRQAGIALGHRRLAIVDLTAAGAQPMHAANERWVTVYNGELYNTEDLRREIEQAGGPIAWRGHSDTEVILEAVSLWGVQRSVERFNGIFALALWDRHERRLWLVRDRLGVKPLYWSKLTDGTLVFGSELRALRRHGRCPTAIDPVGLGGFLSAACVPAPRTIYRNVFKLPPAHILAVGPDSEPELTCYWNLREIASAGQRNLDRRDEDDLVDDLEALLLDAAGRQMVADVPLGAFLSGGIDSSLVVALMQARSNRPVRTFSIGFADANYNEAHHAAAVANHLHTQHTELIVEPSDALAVIERIPDIYDEPFADSSQIPTFLVSELARRHVTVALSGDGGDECFGGYTRYHWIARMAKLTGTMPGLLLRGAGAALQSLSVEAWDAVLSPLPRRFRPTHIGDKIHKGASLLGLRDADAMYHSVVAQWREPGRVMPGFVDSGRPAEHSGLATDLPDLVARLRYFDMMQYLPDDILTKVDRASMAASLEARVPLLDHRVVEYSWRLPRASLGNASQGKRILRQVLKRHVPAALFERPKQGFGIPIGQWLHGPLSEWAAELLSEQALKASGLFDIVYVRQRFHEHQSGRRNWQYALWTVLMFQTWFRRWA
jgi:asparagine synthase (glutamine-hydrolysing)